MVTNVGSAYTALCEILLHCEDSDRRPQSSNAEHRQWRQNCSEKRVKDLEAKNEGRDSKINTNVQIIYNLPQVHADS